MKYLLLLLLSFNLHAFEECSHLKNDCEYYSCVENIKRCGKNKYLISFGLKYCNKFEKRSDRFSIHGQKWINQVKECLIDGIDSIDPNLSCRQFKRASIKYHSYCYIKADYCSLSRSDKRKIKNTIKGQLWRTSIIRAGFKVLNNCRKN